MNGKYEYKQIQIKGSIKMDMNRQKRIMIPSNIYFLGSLVHCRRSWLEQWEWGRWLWFWVKYPFCEWWYIMNIWYKITTRVHIMIMIMMHAGNQNVTLWKGHITTKPKNMWCQHFANWAKPKNWGRFRGHWKQNFTWQSFEFSKSPPPHFWESIL